MDLFFKKTDNDRVDAMIIPRNAVVVVAVVICCMILIGRNEAQAAGECADCHVMHASQLGVATGSGANDKLLFFGCLNCHGASGPADAPNVYVNAGTSLAGGDFDDSVGANERRGHNPVDIAADTTLTEPPGWELGYTDAAGAQIAPTEWAANQLTCAGTFGCHGDHSVADSLDSMAGSHHANQTGYNDGSTLAKSYRFLNGVKGIEDLDWEETVSVDDRNVYYGVDRVSDDNINVDKGTISYLCAQCHGMFHSNDPDLTISDAITGIKADGTMVSPWIRHPTDFDMTFNGTTYDYGDSNGVKTYQVDIPLATKDVATLVNAAAHNTLVFDGTADNRIVMCLSCHRAHASPNASALRWAATAPQAGVLGNAGCLACHSAVDGTDGWN